MKRAIGDLGRALQRRKLADIRALMDLQELQPKSKLLDHSPEQGYKWVLTAKPQTRRWF